MVPRGPSSGHPETARAESPRAQVPLPMPFFSPQVDPPLFAPLSRVLPPTAPKVFEELDAPNEFFFDRQTSSLYLYYNGTGAPPASVEVPALNELIVLQGSADDPVANLSLSGLTFTGQRPTYLEPHGLPSGGDWGMTRLAAVRAKGTFGFSVRNCTFQRLDGNAVLLDGYNRAASIQQVRFAH